MEWNDSVTIWWKTDETLRCCIRGYIWHINTNSKVVLYVKRWSLQSQKAEVSLRQDRQLTGISNTGRYKQPSSRALKTIEWQHLINTYNSTL